MVFATWPWPITFSFGVVKSRPVVVDNKVVARPIMPLVLVFDRRIMGGGPAGRLLARMVEILEQPEKYLLNAADLGDSPVSKD